MINSRTIELLEYLRQKQPIHISTAARENQLDASEVHQRLTTLENHGCLFSIDEKQILYIYRDNPKINQSYLERIKEGIRRRKLEREKNVQAKPVASPAAEPMPARQKKEVIRSVWMKIQRILGWISENIKDLMEFLTNWFKGAKK